MGFSKRPRAGSIGRMKTIAGVLRIVALAGMLPSCGQASPTPANPEPHGAGDSKAVQITTPGPSGPTTPTPPHAWPAGVPARSECTADADCVVVVDAPAGDPCCDVTVTAEPIARRFVEFVAAFRARECAGVRCPPQMIPGAQLAPCGYEGRCVSGRCGNACGAPAVAPPSTSGVGAPAGGGES